MNQLKTFYDKLEGRRRTEFRIEVMNICGWAAPVTFYRKMNEVTPITGLETQAIENVIARY
jgi:hypothetical protein